MFGAHVSQRELETLSRNLGVALYSGVPIVRCFELSSQKAQGQLKPVLADIVQQIKSGGDVTTALESQGGYFPPLFVDMVSVGEQAGALPEVLKALAKHYEANIRLRKDFLGQIALPVIQLVAAVFVIALLILLLGLIGGRTGEPIDVLGWGLMGPRGALIWLSFWGMGIVAAIFLWKTITATLSGQSAVHRLLLKLPVVGHCLQSFAIARFSWAFALTQQAGMPIDKSLESSFRATSNGAYAAASPGMIQEVMQGETLTEALDHSELFPREFIETVLVAETSGTVPEALDRLSPEFEDAARRSLRILTSTLAGLIWMAVAGFIIFVIISIFMWYVGLYNDALRDAMK